MVQLVAFSSLVCETLIIKWIHFRHQESPPICFHTTLKALAIAQNPFWYPLGAFVGQWGPLETNVPRSEFRQFWLKLPLLMNVCGIRIQLWNGSQIHFSYNNPILWHITVLVIASIFHICDMKLFESYRLLIKVSLTSGDFVHFGPP